MKRFITYILIAAIAFVIGVAITIFHQLKAEPVPPFSCYWAERVSGKNGYDIFNTKTYFGEELNFYHEFTSPETTRYLIKSNSEAADLIEQTPKLNKDGQKIGERVVTFFSEDGKSGVIRISWTEGDEFWFIQTSPMEKTMSLKLLQKVETQCFPR
jgi:hypothetical protein